MKNKNYLKNKKYSPRKKDLSTACENIFYLIPDIDEYASRCYDCIDSISEMYYYDIEFNKTEIKLMKYLETCCRSYIRLAEKSNRGVIAAAKFTNTEEYDLSEYENDNDFIYMGPNDVMKEENFIKDIAKIGEINYEATTYISILLRKSFETENGFNDNQKKEIKQKLLKYAEEEDTYRKEHNCSTLDIQINMINGVFDDRINSIAPLTIVK